MKEIPMCWKCKSVMTTKNPNGSMRIDGCYENPLIHSWHNAKKLCPLLDKNQQHVSPIPGDDRLD